MAIINLPSVLKLRNQIAQMSGQCEKHIPTNIQMHSPGKTLSANFFLKPIANKLFPKGKKK